MFVDGSMTAKRDGCCATPVDILQVGVVLIVTAASRRGAQKTGRMNISISLFMGRRRSETHKEGTY